MTVVDLATAVRTGHRSAVDVVEDHLSRIDRGDAAVNAFNLVTA